jgi:hypothetical protein
MRGRLRWVNVVVMTSALVGATVALANTPASSSAAARVTTTTAPVPRDLVTPEINSLAAQAQQLGSEIASAQAELARLQEQVTIVAARSHEVAPTVTLHVPPVRHKKSTPSTTTTSTTTTTSSTTTTTLCGGDSTRHHHGSQNTAAGSCTQGNQNDN